MWRWNGGFGDVHRQSTDVRELSESMIRRAKSSGAEVKFFCFNEPSSIFPDNRAREPSRRIFRKMNARQTIREHLIAERMRYWLMIARTPLMNPKCPRWRARKNFWALQKRYPDLAKRIGLTEVSVF